MTQPHSHKDSSLVFNILIGLIVVLLPIVITMGFGSITKEIASAADFSEILLLVAYIESGLVLALLAKNFITCFVGVIVASIVFVSLLYVMVSTGDFGGLMGFLIVVSFGVFIVLFSTVIAWSLKYKFVTRRRG